MRLIDADSLETHEIYEGEWVRVVYADDIEDAPTIDAKPKWIPVSERFPQYDEEDGFPYVLVSDGIGTYIGYYVYDYVNQDEPQNGKWYEFNHSSMSGILAWMPLPEPYQEVPHAT